jgi:hypothetical protein
MTLRCPVVLDCPDPTSCQCRAGYSIAHTAGVTLALVLQYHAAKKRDVRHVLVVFPERHVHRGFPTVMTESPLLYTNTANKYRHIDSVLIHPRCLIATSGHHLWGQGGKLWYPLHTMHELNATPWGVPSLDSHAGACTHPHSLTFLYYSLTCPHVLSPFSPVPWFSPISCIWFSS